MSMAFSPMNFSLEPTRMEDAEFDRWVRLLESRTGVTVPLERKPFLLSGLRRRMREAGHTVFASYYEELLDGVRGRVEWAALVDHLTVHETHFFRHQPSFQLIREEWLPEWIDGTDEDQSLHALSVGCSTGEEAFSIAMLLDSVLTTQNPPRRFGITATDVSQPALGVAKNAHYPVARMHEVPVEYWESCLRRSENDTFTIQDRLRKRVGFARVNLLHATRAPFRQLDLIFCQNVLIYFARERRGELLDGLARLLRPSGLLVLGAGEITGWSHPQLTRTGGRQTLAFRRNP